MVSKCRSPAVGCTVNLSMFSRSGYRVAMIHAVQCTSRSSWRRPACEALGRVLFAIRGSFTMPPPWLHESNQEWLKGGAPRSEEHTSELQSPKDLVCRLLLEKKKKEI